MSEQVDTFITTPGKLPHIVSWWYWRCRTTVPTMRELAELPGIESTMVFANATSSRPQFGWDAESTGRADTVILSDDNWQADALRVLDEHPNALHLFGGYQRGMPRLEATLKHVIQRKIRYGIISEAPLNMSVGWRKPLKDLYLQKVLPGRVQHVTSTAEFIASMSGQRFDLLTMIGWPPEKIFPFGYFMPDRGVYAKDALHEDGKARITTVGYLKPYKGVHVLLKALSLIRKWGLDFECNITGEGPCRPDLEQLNRELKLTDSVHFHGFIDYDVLNEMIGDTDVQVCPGLAEPWGVRINESIQAHSATVTSDRLGAADLIDASGAGHLFRCSDEGELAQCLYELLSDPRRLVGAKRAAKAYSPYISNATAARYLFNILHYVCGNTSLRPVPPWRGDEARAAAHAAWQSSFK